MWDIVVIKQDADNYIVMTPNGDVHCISGKLFKVLKEMVESAMTLRIKRCKWVKIQI